ncbi:amino acid permease/ SLC12A domain-containing protein [Diaporthe sp. PMI_573]|nr:amino acid permease/ SLC12A domain-containing protein [Diaporthaceae sp. PMI_573]
MGVPEDQKEPTGISSAQSTSDTHVGVGDVKVAGGGLERRAEFETQRGLSPRHVQLMAIGGSIGTGLFVGIGSVLSQAGPLSLVLGYLFWGILFVWPCYLCVAEMCTFLPIRGTIFELASRFVDPALGFAMGWTYFFAGTMLVCVEYSAVATVIQFWNTEINPAAWIALAMGICVFLNVVAVKWYGESEFIMASLKVLLLFGLVMVTLVTMCGGNPQKDAYGFRNWGGGNYMIPYYAEGDTGKFLGWWSVVIYAGFTIAGPDMLAISAGEIQNPRHTIPRLAKLIFYRLVGFYVIGVLAVGIICSPTDKRLMGAIEGSGAGAAASPWVIGIQNLGITGLPSLINFLILTSGLSCGNAYLYSASRTLYGLARDGQAPRFLLTCTKAGVPVYCVAAVSLITCITFLVSSNSTVTVFYWFVDLTTTALIATYTGMLWTFIGWYRARMAQPNAVPLSDLPYIAPLTPGAAYFACGLGCFTLFFIGFDVFSPFNYQTFITDYFAVAFGPFMFVLWKVIKRTRFVSPAEADLLSGKEQCDEECRIWEDGGVEENVRARLQEMNAFRRAWEKLW